jgi:hypothetical protein
MGQDDAAMKLNLTLLQCLKGRGIEDVFLFTDMTFKTASVQERSALVSVLQKRHHFRVHGVITPCDVCWGEISCEEAMHLERMCFSDNLYTGKFYGSEFEQFVCSQAAVIPGMAIAVKTYSPSTNLPGRAYCDAFDESAQVQVSHSSATKSMFAKAFADHLSAVLGYAHCKGLMLDLFLWHAPDWVNSVIVCDDNEQVNETMTSFHRVDPSALVPPLTMIFVSSEKTDATVYNKQLDEHLKKVNSC